MVLGALLVVGAFSIIGCGWPARPNGHRGRATRRQPLCAAGRRWRGQHSGLRHDYRRCRRRHQESWVGTADPRPDRDAYEQSSHDVNQHAQPRRPCERKRGIPSTVEFVAHETTKANMEAMRPYTGRTEPPRNVFAESNGRGLPTRTFTDRLSLGSGADQVDLYYFGRGHTGGDAWVVFPSLRTLHAGDIFLGKRGAVS